MHFFLQIVLLAHFFLDVEIVVQLYKQTLFVTDSKYTVQ